MTNWEAIVIGIVEGVTEYLPVSSTGHIVLTQRVLGIESTEAANAYAICIQAGAILAVLNLYWRRVAQMIRGVGGWLPGVEGDRHGWQLFRNIVVAFVPAAVVGLLLDDWIEQRLFGLWPIVTAWLVGGLAILVVARYRHGSAGQHTGRTIDELTWVMALRIGLLQCVAMWPGTSRSLVTIVGGMLVGLHLAAAVEFSFLLGVVTLLAATTYKLRDAGPIMLEQYHWWTMVCGVVAAWVSALLAVRWMVNYLKRHGMELFGYYRVILAIVVAIAVAGGWVAS